MVKRQIINLYEEDLRRLMLLVDYQLCIIQYLLSSPKDTKKYRITTAIGKKNNVRSEELLYELIDSKTVLPCFNTTDPKVSLADTKDFDSYKLYIADTGLFVTLMFIDRPATEK